MPGKEYLIQDVRIDPFSTSAQVGTEDEDDMFDDWVLISVDPPKKSAKLEQWNNEEYIKKATLDMTSSESKALMISKDAAYSDNIQLKDFTIKKIIDKGSFGKVFLVQNDHTKKMYAMKRLNKDVIIEKNQVENIKVEKEILF